MDVFSDSPLTFLIENVQKNGDSIALVEGNQTWTWKTFYQETVDMAAWLAKQGISPGQRVAIIASNNSEFFRLMFAVWFVGGIVAPVNTLLPTAQREIIFQRLKPHFVVLGKSDELNLEFPGAVLRVSEMVLTTDGNFSPYRPKPEDRAMIVFTSGTTGIPKGAVNSHQALATNAALTAESLRITPNDRILINTPAFYISAICHIVTMFSQGASLATHQGFLFSNTFLDLIERYYCTAFGGAPSHFARIFETIQPGKKPNNLRFMMSSGDHLPIHLIQKAMRLFPDGEIFCVYGLSEVAGRLCILPSEKLPEKIGSVGKPHAPMTLTVRREGTLEETDAQEIGEVYVQGPLLTDGYFDDECSSAELRTPFGFRTGDFGFLDEDGFLYLKGRRDDIFKSGGEKVSTLMIQQTLSGLGDFDDVAVLPIEDAILMKIPVAFFVPKTETVFSKRRILRKVKDVLPPTHIPTRFIQVERIPRTGSGKVIRHELRAMFEAINVSED